MTTTFKKIKEAQPIGQYKATSLDIRKEEADFCLLQASPFYIQWKSGDREILTASKLKKLQAKYTWVTDF